MDVYTTSFTYPRSSRPVPSAIDLPAPAPADPYPHLHHHLQPPPAPPAALSDADADAVQKLAMMAMSLHGCHVSYFHPDHARGWNFHITGAYQQVMATRGMILKECPIQVPSFVAIALFPYSLASPQHRAAIKVTRSEILDSPSSKPALKLEVRRRLDEIASQTLAHIAVVNSPLSLSNRTPPDGISSSAGWSGLETERVCELVVTGHEDSVELARVRLLVMLDELVRPSLPSFLPVSPFSRAASTPSPAKSTTNSTQSSPERSAVFCRPSKKRLLPTSTSLPPYRV